MRKFIFILFTLGVFSSIQAAAPVHVSPKASEVFVPIAGNKQISLSDLSIISIKDFETVTGKKYNLFQKITFKAGQRKLRHSIEADGTISNKKLLKAVRADNSVGFHIGGFALGFFVGLIGILIAYLIKGDEEVDRNRRKWAWIGFGVWVAILIALMSTVNIQTY